MKLSNETVSVLKNFSTINQNLVIKSGNKIATMSAMKNIVAKAEVLEEFPSNICNLRFERVSFCNLVVLKTRVGI